MKTAGQDFLEWYNDFIKNNGCSPSDYDVNFYWNGGNLQKEKEQIIEAVKTGMWETEIPNDLQEYGENYYDSNFGDKVARSWNITFQR